MAESKNPAKTLEFLVIDNDESILKSCQDLFKYYGHELGIDVKLTSATDGDKGINKFKEKLKSNVPYDAVVTDLYMPNKNGFEVAKEIKELSPETPVYIMTAIPFEKHQKTIGNQTQEVIEITTVQRTITLFCKDDNTICGKILFESPYGDFTINGIIKKPYEAIDILQIIQRA